MFSIQELDLSSIEQCPMLIGIMRRFAVENGSSFTSDYEFQSLLTGQRPKPSRVLGNSTRLDFSQTE